MNIFQRSLLMVSVLAILTFSSCDKDDPIIPNEEELITTLIFTLSPVGGGTDLEFRFTDLDGDGGNAPVILVDTLSVDTDYTAALRLLNETENPAEEITEEIEEEDEEHQFFFSVSGGLDLDIAYADTDGGGNPVGLATSLSAGSASSGTLTITLRHEPDKDAAGVADGNITNAGGETDIEVTFNVLIE